MYSIKGENICKYVLRRINNNNKSVQFEHFVCKQRFPWDYFYITRVLNREYICLRHHSVYNHLQNVKVPIHLLRIQYVHKMTRVVVVYRCEYGGSLHVGRPQMYQGEQLDITHSPTFVNKKWTTKYDYKTQQCHVNKLSACQFILIRCYSNCCYSIMACKNNNKQTTEKLYVLCTLG